MGLDYKIFELGDFRLQRGATFAVASSPTRHSAS